MSKAYFEEPRRGPIALVPSGEPFEARESTIPPSGPFSPRQRVRNDRRTPEPYQDLRVLPNLTGTYFERRGRYRLFINHVGGHLEGMLTLVTLSAAYHKPSRSLEADERLPFDWGIAGFLGRPSKRKHDPIAFRFAADHVGGTYLLTVPVWLGSAKIPISATTDGTYDLGFLEARAGGDELAITWLGWFVDRWFDAERAFGVKSAKDELQTLAIRDARQPVLLDRYLARPSVPYHVRTHYWFPLTPQQRDNLVPLAREIYRMRASVHVDRGYLLDRSGREGTRLLVYDLLMAERGLGMGHQARLVRDNLVIAIDDIVRQVFDNAYTTPVEHGGLGQDDLVHLRARVLRILDGWTLEASEGHGEQSVGAALQRLVDRASFAPANYSHLEKYLDLAPRGWRKFRYEVEVKILELVDFEDEEKKKAYGTGKTLFDKIKKAVEEQLVERFHKFAKFKGVMKYLPLTYLLGHMTVRYRGVVEGETGGPQDEPWEAIYGIGLGGIQLSKSAGKAGGSFAISGPTELWASRPHTKEDLAGTMTYAEGHAVAGLDIGVGKGKFSEKVGAAKSMLTMYGSADEPSISFLFEGKLAADSIGASASGKVLAGIAWLLDGSDGTLELEPKAKGEEEAFEGYWQDRVASLAVHFPINGARLCVPTEEERALMREQGKLAVKEALDAFAACELPLIANPLSRIELGGYADAPDERERNLELSKNRAESVRNYLHGVIGSALTLGLSDEDLAKQQRIIVVGHGEPPAADDPKNPSPSIERFDPAERRVDIKVSLYDGTRKGHESLEWKLRRSKSK